MTQKNNSQAIEEIKLADSSTSHLNPVVEKLITYLKSKQATHNELRELGQVLLASMIKQESEACAEGDLAGEKNWFHVFTHTGPYADKVPNGYPDGSFFDFLIKGWIRFSKSSYAEAYRLGAKSAESEIKKNNVRRAAKGRRLIGAASRAKVAKTAEAFQHLSKELAAAQIAEIVNLGPGTIRRYLSELFPGDKWKNKL